MRPSFESAFADEFRPLYEYLWRRVGAGLAEEVAEETFTIAYRNWDRFEAGRPVRPWLHGIAANVLRHHWRREARMLRAFARTGVDPIATDDEAREERADAARGTRALAEALAALRPPEREILLLHAWAALTDVEIAEALQLPLGTVKSKLHRTRERLRNQLGEHGQSVVEALMTETED